MAKHKQGKRSKRKHYQINSLSLRNMPAQSSSDDRTDKHFEELLQQNTVILQWSVLTSEFEEVKSGKLLYAAPTKTYAFDNPHKHLGTGGKKGEIWMCLPTIVDAAYIHYIDDTASVRCAVVPYVDYNVMKRVITSTLADAQSSFVFNYDLKSHQERILKPLLSKLHFIGLNDQDRRPLWQEIQSLNLAILRETPNVPRRNAMYGFVGGFPL